MMAQIPPVSSPSMTPPAPGLRRGSLAIWCVGLGLLANAAVMLYSKSSAPAVLLDSHAFAQNAPGMLGARGIYMMPSQLGPRDFGFLIMDLDSSTVCVYKTMPEENRIRFMAARSFKSDRFLEDFNNAIPTPKDVAKLVQQQRQRNEINNPEKSPEKTPEKPDDKSSSD